MTVDVIFRCSSANTVGILEKNTPYAKEVKFRQIFYMLFFCLIISWPGAGGAPALLLWSLVIMKAPYESSL